MAGRPRCAAASPMGLSWAQLPSSATTIAARATTIVSTAIQFTQRGWRASPMIGRSLQSTRTISMTTGNNTPFNIWL